MATLLQTDEEGAIFITENELRHALLKGEATSPGGDGITYPVLRLFQKVPGNPLLRLYNLCLGKGYVPQA